MESEERIKQIQIEAIERAVTYLAERGGYFKEVHSGPSISLFDYRHAFDNPTAFARSFVETMSDREYLITLTATMGGCPD